MTSLQLNIPGAQADVAEIETNLAQLDAAGQSQLANYRKLAGAIQGIGMDTATEFSQHQNQAITGVHDVAQRCTGMTQTAINDTIGYDRGIAGGKMGPGIA